MKVIITHVGKDTRYHPNLKLGDIVEIDETVKLNKSSCADVIQNEISKLRKLCINNDISVMDINDHSVCYKGSWIFQQHSIHGSRTETDAMLYKHLKCYKPYFI